MAAMVMAGEKKRQIDTQGTLTQLCALRLRCDASRKKHESAAEGVVHDGSPTSDLDMVVCAVA